MHKKNILAVLILLAAGSLLIAACSGPKEATQESPTIDANVIYTQAAQTVQASIAQTDAVKPTTPATETPAPTNTMDPNIAAAMTATAQAVQPPQGGTNATATPAAGLPLPTATLAALPTATTGVVAQPPKTKGDKAELYGQSPADGSRVQKNASFDVSIVLKNTGTTTWTNKYALVFYAGDRMGSPRDFLIPQEVKPGETVNLQFEMKAGDSKGKKKTIWAVRNADGVNFYDLWLELEVVD